MPRDDEFSPESVEDTEYGDAPEDAESADGEDADGDEPPRGPFDDYEPETDGDDEAAEPAAETGEDEDDSEEEEELDLDELKAKAANADKWEAYHRNQQQQLAFAQAQQQWARQEREADNWYDAQIALVRQQAPNTPDPDRYRDFHEARINRERVQWHKTFEGSKFSKREQAIAALQVPLYAQDVAVHWQIPRKYIPEIVSRAGGDPQKFNYEAERLRLHLDEVDALKGELDQYRKGQKAREIAEKRVGPGQGRPSGGGAKPGTLAQLREIFDASRG